MILWVFTYMHILKPTISSHCNISPVHTHLQIKIFLPSTFPNCYEDEKFCKIPWGKMMKAINHFIHCPSPQIFKMISLCCLLMELECHF